MNINKIHNLNKDLSCCLQNLDSHKITERKTKRQEIQQLLENDDVIEVLNNNSSKKLQKSQSLDGNGDLVTWKYLLNCYHRSLILEIEKEDIKRRKLGTNYKQPNLESYSSLLRNIINKANKEEPHISGDDLIKCILDVSQNDVYQFFMGEVYYKILEQNILSQSYYWPSLSGHWNNLFSLAIKLYSVHFGNMKHLSIKIMKHLIFRGDAHSSVTLIIKKKIFSYLKQAISDTLKVKNDFYLREDLILLTFVLCKTIGVECRKSLCIFIEENCNNFINFYENDRLKKVQETLYQMLTLFINIHHPKCVSFNNKATYFSNEKIWITQLYQIYEFVHRELKLRINHSNPNFLNYISELAVTIFNMVFFNELDNINLTLEDYPIPKRKKSDRNFSSFVNNELLDLKTSEFCIKLNIVTKLLQNYSFLFHENDYINLLNCLTKCLNFYKDTESIKYLIICCNVLIKLESINNLLTIKYNKVSPFFKTLWTFVLNTIMSNEYPDLSHNLLQSLILLKNWHDEMYSDILRPYFNKTIKMNDYSLNTLTVLFNTRGFCHTFLNETNMLLLIDWLLPIQMEDELLIARLFSKVNPYVLSKVVDLILTKPRIDKPSIIHHFKPKQFKDFTNIYFYLVLQDIPKVKLEHTTFLEPKTDLKRTIDSNMFQRLTSFVVQAITINGEPNILTLQLFLSLTNFLCFMENQFSQFNNKCDEFCMYKIKCMDKVKNLVSELHDDVNQLNNEKFVNICLLFYKNLQLINSEILNQILNHEANKIIMFKLFNLSKLNEPNNLYQVFDYDSLTTKQKLSIKAVETLLNTCLYKGQILDYQISFLEMLIQDLKQLEDLIYQPYTYFKLTGFLNIILNSDNLPIDIIIQVNKFIKQLAKKWCFHQDGFIHIAQLLRNVLSMITKNNSNKVCTTNILMIIWSLQKISNGKKCGPTMICAFVDLLGHFAFTKNGNFGSSWNIDDNMVKPLSPENILHYINNSFLQVRITVIKYIKVMCEAYENNADTYIISYEKMFNIIIDNIHKGFIVESDLGKEELEDEYTNRIATYLLTMQTLIIYSPKYRQKSLFEIFQTVNDKKINLNLLINLLEGVAIELKIKSYKQLLENNLNFLLWNWYSKYTTFKDFPIKLFACTTIDNFFRDYSFEVIPILVINNDVNEINSMDILHEVIIENFAVIFSYLLVIKIKNVLFFNYDQIKISIENVIGQQHFNELIKSQFSNILLKCIQILVINTEQPIFPIQMNSDQFMNIINIFQETYVKSKIPFLTVMAKKQPNYIQTIVHILYVNIFKKSTSELKFQSFFQYTFFMKILIDQLSEYNEIDEFTYFLVFQSIRSINTIINQNNFEIQHHAFDYLEWLIINAQRFLQLNYYQSEDLIMPTLKIIAKNQPLINDKLLNTLNILKKINDKHIDCIINKEDSNTLDEDIITFLSQQKKSANIIQDLQHLKLKLKSSENQLQVMYEDLLNIRGFSEDCFKSLLHRLILALIQLTKNCDFEIQILAASCLGCLGPGDLTTLILQPEPEVSKIELNTSPEYLFMKLIVEMLLNYLSDDNISVLEASNIALFKIMETHKGQSLYEELGGMVLYPFKLKQSKIKEQDVELSFDMEQLNVLIDINEIWCPIDPSISYNSWITKITIQLLQTFQGFCTSLLPIAGNKPVFCENILPHLIYFILVYKPLTRPILNKHLNCFFIKHNETKKKNSITKINTNIFEDSSASGNNIYCNKSAIQCFLNIISFIRHQQKNLLQNVLDINYLYVSQAAQFCSAHFSSILYLELWCDIEFKRLKKDHWSMALNPVDMITEILPEDGLLLQSILNESYKSIGDSDAIEGCGSSYLLTFSSRTQYYQLLRKWDRVMENCDLQQTTETVTKDYLEAFSYSGLQNLAYVLASNNDSLKYDYCWQLDKWDLPDNGDKSFEALHYHAIRYVYQKNVDSAISVINEAKLAIIDSLSQACLESTSTLYIPLAKLKIIEDLEDFIVTEDKNKLFENWLDKNSLKTNDFVNINKILLQRSKLLDFEDDNRSGILRLCIAEIAKNNDWLKEAGRNLATVISMQNYEKHTILWAKVEEARLLWQRNDCHMAKILLKFVVDELDNYEYPFLHSLALQLYGSWMEETKSETANNIIKKYFQKSINILPMSFAVKKEYGLECRKVLTAAHKHISQFTDTLYQQISKYIKTEDLQKRIHEVKNDKKKGKALLDFAKSIKNHDKIRAGMFLMNQSNIDESDISNINTEKIKYLEIALENYLQLMLLDDESELPVYRIISLWLDNKENNKINAIVDNKFKVIPSYKFIIVLPQLVAHLSCTYEYDFHKSLENLIERCVIDHPYQTIPIVYAVANSNIDHQFTNCSPLIVNNEETRVIAAKHLMSKWKNTTKIGCIIMNTEKLYEAFIHLAYTKFSCSQGQRIEIPNEQPLMKIQNSGCYMYPAATLYLNKHGQYPNIISIESIKNSFLNAGGIHQPKKIDCICSDGIIRSLLLKGNEDMRQDAVMQQVFVLMNKLLKSNKLSAKRKLTIRTYKVIPFSQQSGIAEWCVNSTSLSDYLIGKSPNLGAHQTFRPDDMLPLDARNIIKLSKENNDSQFTKLKKYFDICTKLKPAFRYYFFEKFLLPSIWFEKRQSYIHSVATTSMVGYILGIGDRHLQNILIDNNTAELIHIDFGVAFEQGTLLPTPETVPFRLSRDIVDGMGICGIEGTFRKCCEKTMSVLRQNQDVIFTVIEVLLYDPCYHWTLTEEKAARLQNQSTTDNSNVTNLTEVNKLAERSLNRIRVKLCGMEEAGNAASINGQVNRLIQQARDPINLSLLFHGWQAYL